jgi:hypothetical protein
MACRSATACASLHVSPADGDCTAVGDFEDNSGTTQQEHNGIKDGMNVIYNGELILVGRTMYSVESRGTNSRARYASYFVSSFTLATN